jgi:Putative DNA-binding domain
VPGLAEIQSLVREAVVAGQTSALEPLLAGGSKARTRFDIHRRNYEASLTNALLEKFPACAWLAGNAFLSQAAMLYVERHPPEAPCIAEYGGSFPKFLSESPGAERVPYLRPFAELEWCLGHVAIAVDEPCVPPDAFSAIPAELLPDLTLSFQPGVRYVEAEWPVDDLIKLYLAESAPEFLSFEPAAVWLEIRGARGEFSLTRLGRGEFLFRRSIREANSIAAAAESALDASANFDPGTALASLIACGLVTGIGQDTQE